MNKWNTKYMVMAGIGGRSGGTRVASITLYNCQVRVSWFVIQHFSHFKMANIYINFSSLVYHEVRCNTADASRFSLFLYPVQILACIAYIATAD